MPLDGDKILSEYPVSWSKEYFGASFVKLVEMTGGRAVSISEVGRGRGLFYRYLIAIEFCVGKKCDMAKRLAIFCKFFAENSH